MGDAHAAVVATSLYVDTRDNVVSAQAASALNALSLDNVSMHTSINTRIGVASTLATTRYACRRPARGHGTRTRMRNREHRGHERMRTRTRSVVAVVAVDGRVTSVQSAVSHLGSVVSNVSAVSGAGTAVGLQSVVNALSTRIEAVAGAGGITSTVFNAKGDLLVGTANDAVADPPGQC